MNTEFRATEDPDLSADIGTILGCAENTVKVHTARIFEKLGFENRNAATVRALEVLSRQTPRK